MLLTTKHLLEKDYPFECEDKVYLVCEIVQTAQGWDAHLFSQDHVLWLNSSYKDLYGYSSDFVVQELSKQPESGKSILSAGAVVYYENRLVLLKRDEKAPVFALHLNEPCGRCGELPQVTIFKELAEELGVTLNSESAYFQANNDLGFISKNITDVDLQKKAVYLTLNNKKLNLPINTVNVYLDFELIQTIEGVSVFDKKNNVLEVRQVFEINSDQKCSFFDNESYGREIKILTLEEASKEKCVPYLEHIMKLSGF